ncbi:MAG: hypothetical protein H7X77_07390 [Anaerolineae bacterium]|nr:hypothetical protein [Anaerolineae bacterium]
MNDLLHDKLNTLHTQNQLDNTFADQLEQTLCQAHQQQMGLPVNNAKSNRLRVLYPDLTTLAASLIIVVVLFATVPPLRSLAQELINFFVPSARFNEDAERAAYADVVQVNSVVEAETLAGIDALEWTASDYAIRYISAAEGTITITYEQTDTFDHGNLIMVSQFRTGTRPETEPVSPEAYVQQVTVRGVEGEFVAGAWFRRVGQDYEWEADYDRQLYWQQGGISYHLRVASPIANTAPEVVQIAEALQ